VEGWVYIFGHYSMIPTFYHSMGFDDGESD
jgi:hypothetical protein